MAGAFEASMWRNFLREEMEWSWKDQPNPEDHFRQPTKITHVLLSISAYNTAIFTALFHYLNISDFIIILFQRTAQIPMTDTYKDAAAERTLPTTRQGEAFGGGALPA
jgi:hypothetical protein